MRTPPPRLIGMVHLLPLPGSPGARPLAEVRVAALADAEALLDAGFGGLVVENYGDVPFYGDRVPPITVAAMTLVATELRALCGQRPLAVNVLRNDARAALAVAAAAGCAAIRVNVHAGARLTDQGLLQGRAERTLRLRREWGADGVAIWADAAVKHSSPVGPERPIEQDALDLVHRACADAVIVSGAATGAPVDPERLDAVRAVLGGVPVIVGSGVDAGSVAGLLGRACGVIVGTATKAGGRTSNPVDPARARAIVEAAGEETHLSR